MKGYVRTGHLVYIIIIAVVVLSFFLVIAFGDSDQANTTMGTASTVSSLILSVIAIVLSLIDVAGQRQSIVDLKETAEKLQSTNETANSLVQEVLDKMVELQEMKDQMVKAVADSSSWRREIVEKIEEIKEKGGSNSEELDEVLKEMKSKRIELPKINSRFVNDIERKVYYMTLQADIINFLKNHFVPENRIAFSKFEQLIKEKFSLSNSNFIKVHNELLHGMYIKTMADSSGETFVTLNKKLFD